MHVGLCLALLCSEVFVFIAHPCYLAQVASPVNASLVSLSQRAFQTVQLPPLNLKAVYQHGRRSAATARSWGTLQRYADLDFVEFLAKLQNLRTKQDPNSEQISRKLRQG